VGKIYVVDRVKERLEAVREIGADAALDSDEGDVAERIRDQTGGAGVDYVLDAVGISATRRGAVGVCRRGGRMGFLGLGENETSLPFIEMIRNELAIITSFAYSPRDFAESVRLIEAGRVGLQKWVEVRRLEEGQESFLKMAHRPGGTLKLLLEVGGA
jgi:threonine dehydrogenase-like Zn-dependent dehydrogenase